MDAADDELRRTLKKIWPYHSKRIDLYLPPDEGMSGHNDILQLMRISYNVSELCYEKLSVGKIYAALMILETWRAKKSGKVIEVIKYCMHLIP